MSPQPNKVQTKQAPGTFASKGYLTIELSLIYYLYSLKNVLYSDAVITWGNAKYIVRVL